MNSTPSRSVAWADAVLVACFLVLISLPLVLQVFLGGEKGDPEERRAERPVPRLRLDRPFLQEFPQRFENYFDDHFRLRRSMVRVHHLTKMVLFRDSPSEAVILGKEGWLFYNGAARDDGDPVADYRGTRPLTESQCLHWRSVVQARGSWLGMRGIRYLVVIAPNKEAVYSEYMPDALHPVSNRSPANQLPQHLRGVTNLCLIDLRPDLLEAARKQRVYALTDTHWNQQGAFFAYETIMRTVESWFPGVTPHAQDDFAVVRRDDRGGDLAGLLALSDRLVEPSAPAFLPRFASLARQVPGHGSDDQEWRTESPDLPSAVVFHDSFGNALIPFLKEHFRRIWFHNVAEAFDQALIEDVRPQVVMTILAERNLRVLCTPSAASGMRASDR